MLYYAVTGGVAYNVIVGIPQPTRPDGTIKLDRFQALQIVYVMIKLIIENVSHEERDVELWNAREDKLSAKNPGLKPKK